MTTNWLLDGMVWTFVFVRSCCALGSAGCSPDAGHEVVAALGDAAELRRTVAADDPDLVVLAVLAHLQSQG